MKIKVKQTYKSIPMFRQRLLHLTFIAGLMAFSFCAQAQDNLRVNYANAASVPSFLNVCGDAEEVTVMISVNGTSTDTRENIVASLNLFQGIQFDSFNAAASSAGVTLLNGGNLSMPEFSIPNLDPFGVTSVEVTFSITANCEILDTIMVNNNLSVFDTWDLNYDLAGTNITETDITSEYRDALAIPFFSIEIDSELGPFKSGDCYVRDVLVTNSGLDGFTDNLTYTVQQGAGATIQSIVVNGTTMNLIKLLDPITGDTVITVEIGGVEFQGNTVGQAAGNGDGFIDPNETVTISETICIIDCEGRRESLHEASWGCLDRICSSVSISDFARIGEGSANPVITVGGIVPNVDVGYCQEGTTSLTITNEGVELDPGFGTMINVELAIGMGSAFQNQDGGFAITSYSIAGVTMTGPGPNFMLDNNPLFTTDPDGAGGLSDFDNDGFFDDLELTESVEIAATFEFDCSLAQSLDDACINDFSTFFTGRTIYDDGCGPNNSQVRNGFLRPSNINSDIEDFSDPDAQADGAVFYVTHTESRSVRLFEKNCGDGEFFRATVTLPNGISPVIAESFLFKNQGSTPLTLLNNTVTGNTLELIFDATNDSFLNGNYELIMAFQADCDAEIGPSVFPFTFEFVCPTCTCEHLWYCADINGPFIHKEVPPCPPDPNVICQTGLRTTGFDAYRTSFGYTDATYSAPYNPANANVKVAVSCDSVEMVITSVVGETPINGAIGFEVNYGNIDGSTNLDGIFNFSNGEVTIISGGSTYTCPVTAADLTEAPVDGLNVLRFDLPNCLSDLGITLNPADEITFTGDFTVNPDGPYDVQFKKVPNFRAWGFAVINGTDEFCETYGDIFTVAKTNTLFAYPNSNNFPTGCEETFLNYQVISVFNDFPSYYNDEFYPSIKVDSVKFTFDPEILNAFTLVEPMVSIPGHPIYGNDFFAVPGFEVFPNGDYVAYFDTLNVVPSLNEVRSYSFNFRVRIIPNCESIFGSTNGDNQFNFDPEFFYQNRYYANSIGDPACVDFVQDYVDNDITYTEPPTFSFNPLSNPNFILIGDTATWDLQLCNTSFDSDAGLTWFSIENPDNDIVVHSIEDLSDPTNPQSISFNTFGAAGYNVFSFTDGLLRADGLANPADICNIYRVKATVSRCGELFLTAKAGWSCIPYDNPAWTPLDYEPCEDMELNLSISTRDPFIDANVDIQPDPNLGICAANSVTIRIRNNDLGAVFDMQSIINLPEGVDFLPGTFEIAYPSDAAFVSIPTDPTLIGSNTVGEIFEYADFAPLNAILDNDGLPGFDPTNPGVENEFLLRFDFTTTCDFTSGSLVFYSFQGVKGCTDLTNLEAGETLPITINGTFAGSIKLFQIGLTPGSVLIPESTSNLEITTQNLTNEPSSSSVDRIKFTLPAGVTYAAGSTSVVQPGTWTPGEPTITVLAGQEILEWPLPDGLQMNDIATLNIQVNTPDLGCEFTTLDGFLSVLSNENFLCETDSQFCNGSSITSTDNGSPYSFVVQQGALTFDVNNYTSTCSAGNGETVTIEGNIINGMLDFPASSFNVDYFEDANDNGILDPADIFIVSFVESGPIPANGSIPFSHTIDSDISQVCNLVLSVDVSTILNNDCGATEIFFGPPRLENAGSNQIICSNAGLLDLNLGSVDCDPNAYTYDWIAIAPADIINLSATDIPNPVLSLDMDSQTATELIYVLTTTRPNCGTSRDSIVLTVGAPPAITVSSDAMAVCAGFTAVLTAENADTYTWFEGGVQIGTGASISVNPTSNTTYTVEGIGLNGCSSTETITIDVDQAECPCEAAVVSSIVSVMATCGNTDGQVTINITGDPSGYSYNWTPMAGIPQGSGNVRSDLPFGGYTIEIISNESSSCLTEAFAIVTNEDGPEASMSTTPASCDAADGTAVLSPANYNYVWGDGTTTNTRNDLTSGVHFVTFTDPAEPGCENVILVLVQEDNPLEATATILNNPACGASDGSAQVVPANGSGNYSFLWSDGSTSDTRSDLMAGIHAVTITDNTSACELPFIFILTDDVPQGTVTIDNVNHISCYGADNGGVNYNVVYDPLFTSPADTMFSNGFATFANDALPPGSYCIQITDANGCVAGGDCFTIEEPEELIAYIETSPDCGGNGTIATTVIGGTPLYTFDWGDIPGTNNSSFRQNLVAGVYPLTIIDANGCVLNMNPVNIETCPCTVVEVSSISIIESTCGNAEGEAIINLIGNPADYIYSWSPNAGTTGANDNQRTALAAGQYFVTIQDPSTNRCDEVVDFVITNSDGPDATYTSTPATCNAADGSADLSPGTFDYLWPDGTTGNIRLDLQSGSYVVEVRDPANPTCENYIEVIIQEDNPLLAIANVNQNPDCGESNGSVTIVPSGTSGPYAFAWPDGSTLDSRSDLAGGYYVVTITDLGQTGCELPFLFVLTEAVPQANVSIQEVMDVSCYGLSDGSITYTVTYPVGFSEPADTVISDGFYFYENGFLPAGNYCMAILDSEGCYSGEACFTIEEPEALEMMFVIQPACENGGSVEVMVNGGTPNFIFDWADLPNTNDDQNRFGLTAGIYSLTVVDQNDCSIFENNIVVPVCDQTDCDYFFGQTAETIDAAACDQMATYCVDVPLADIGNYTIMIDGFEYTGPTNTCASDPASLSLDFAVGTYTLSITNTFSNCTDELILTVNCIPVCDYFFGQTTQTISSVEACMDQGELCIDVPVADIANYNIIVDNVPYGGAVLGCSNNPAAISIQLAVGMHQVIVENNIEACSDTLNVIVECAECDYFFGLENTTITSAAACDNLGVFCVDLTAIEAGNFIIELNGSAYTGAFVACPADQDLIAMQLPLGTNIITLTNNADNCSDEITVEVVCEPCDYFTGQTTTTINSVEACDDEGLLCTGILQADANNFSIFVDDVAYTGLLLNCDTDPNNLAIQLAQGNHEVVIVNNIENCSDTLSVEVICDECDYFDGQEEVTISSTDVCETGEGSICITIDSTVLTEYTIELDGVPFMGDIVPCPEGVNSLSISIPIGMHEVVVTNTTINCSDTLAVLVECPACDYFNGESEVLIENAEACIGETGFCIDILFEELGNYEILLDASIYDGTIGECRIDTSGGYSYAPVFGQGQLGPYELVGWTVNDTTFTGTFNTIEDLIDLMVQWDPAGNWILDSDNQFLDGGDPSIMYGQLMIIQTPLNVSSDLPYNFGFDPQGFTIQLDTGFHEIIVTDTLNNCSDTVIVEVRCLPDECEFFGGLDSLAFFADNCDGLQQFCIEGYDDDTLNYLDIFVDQEVYMDLIGNCAFDSTSTYPYTPLLGQGESGPYEIISWEVNDTIFTGNFNTIAELIDLMNMLDPDGNWGLSPNGPGIDGGLKENDYGDMLVVATSFGVESTLTVQLNLNPQAGFILVDTGYHEVIFADPITGCSDTIIVFADPAMLQCNYVFDTIMPMDTVEFCIDTMSLTALGNIVSIENICDSLSGESVIFELDSNYCVTYTGIALGVDTACIEICDDMGICDTTYFVITVIHDSELVKDTIFPGEIVTFCLDTSFFAGSMLTIENSCPDQSNENVDFFLDEIAYCVEYSGIESGVDSACVVICDDLGYCDTTLFCIVVGDVDGPPIAVNDIDTTSINTPKVINFKTNDSIFGVLDTVFLVTDPIYGEATINLDCSLTYDPYDDFCDVVDEFDYAICNQFGCDTATISIFIDCQGEIVIYTAVSPNGDGANDFFHIGGIDFYPNNRLCIFNRWGNQVLQQRGYKNDFEGRWNGKDLPDGTYYYVLELNDEDNRVLSGFFEMYR